MAKELSPSDFGELANDEEFINRIKDFQSNLKNVEKLIDDIEENDSYNSLSSEDKVRLVMFFHFSFSVYGRKNSKGFAILRYCVNQLKRWIK